MPIEVNKDFLAAANGNLMRRIQAAAERLVELHKDDVSVPVVRDERGRVVERSLPNEYPRLETGQGHENIDFVLDLSDRSAAAGYVNSEYGTVVPTRPSRKRPPGAMHLRFLRLGEAPNVDPRKGIDHTFTENKPEIARAFFDAIK